jgi:hypothetical protein
VARGLSAEVGTAWTCHQHVRSRDEGCQFAWVLEAPLGGFVVVALTFDERVRTDQGRLPACHELESGFHDNRDVQLLAASPYDGCSRARRQGVQLDWPALEHSRGVRRQPRHVISHGISRLVNTRS